MDPIALLIGLGLGGAIGWFGRTAWRSPKPDSSPSLDQLQHYLWQWHDRHAQSLDLSLDRQTTLEQHLQALGDRLGAIEQQLNTLPAVSIDPEPAPLASEIGFDYLPLNDLLGNGQWQAADTATRDYLLAALGKSTRDSLTPDDLQHLPLTDLATINQLWSYWSGGRFGWTAQQVAWQAAQGDYGQFCDRVGWRKGESWCYADELSFRDNAPIGHLPTIVWTKRACYGLGAVPVSSLLAALLDRLAQADR
ncbi:GUN4 domain-containing protein [Limnothrix sp. FACHB-1083]|uniref:GUN4 domain-containing protein n=1 Tax=unclassified Limnothrix TaxID=2632864 RepID=UPI001680BD68|nr:MULTISPECIES: GUN4 domain-containing protein [unclassified Limnothrix]MBD2161807.1 GUN4 domain-containing protein [Limnothrix sp. FACHB-1083]MBD2192616.1 GUN4 domain-containing protein [Limnothrix sp. FACHB-1088]